MRLQKNYYYKYQGEDYLICNTYAALSVGVATSCDEMADIYIKTLPKNEEGEVYMEYESYNYSTDLYFTFTKGTCFKVLDYSVEAIKLLICLRENILTHSEVVVIVTSQLPANFTNNCIIIPPEQVHF